MFVNYKGTVFGIIFRWQWKWSVFFVVAATLVWAAHEYLATDLLTLPTFPLVVIGGAIGIFVSFRTNSAYDRWWEGRKLWGRMVNASRHFCTQVLSYPAAETPVADRHALVRRQIAYVHTLRCLLRLQDPLKDAQVLQFLTEAEKVSQAGESNQTHALLQIQTDTLTALANRGQLAEFRLANLDRTIQELLAVQGGCERIKKTPFPRGYGFIAERLIALFSLVLPMALVPIIGWVAIPMNLVLCMAFLLISEVGRVLEDPFTMFWPALPLSALSTTIEINLRQRIGDTDLPAAPQPDANGILM